MLNPCQIWAREALDTVSIATTLLGNAAVIPRKPLVPSQHPTRSATGRACPTPPPALLAAGKDLGCPAASTVTTRRGTGTFHKILRPRPVRRSLWR